MTTDPKSAEEWARLLKAEWDERARSPSRDFFIASHVGWDDPVVWAAQAKMDAGLVLREIPGEDLRRLDVLEIGCGVGRLAATIAPDVRSYTGFDISPELIDNAKTRCSHLSNARFLVADGTSLPEAVLDRRYGLIFALAVFIHCPKVVIASVLRSAFPALVDDGVFRIQLLADYEDLTGIMDPVGAAAQSASAVVMDNTPVPEKQLAQVHHYMGERFGYEEARAFLKEATGGEVFLLRLDRMFIYAQITRPR